MADYASLIRPTGFGKRKKAAFVYLTATLDAATWGAELALGEGRGRIYTVDPTGPIEDDPNLTDKKYPGNITKSYRTRDPLRVTGEVKDWQGHSPEQLKAMKDNVERSRWLGVDAIEDGVGLRASPVETLFVCSRDALGGRDHRRDCDRLFRCAIVDRNVDAAKRAREDRLKTKIDPMERRTFYFFSRVHERACRVDHSPRQIRGSNRPPTLAKLR